MSLPTGSRVEVMGRITRVVSRRNDRTVFQVVTPKTGNVMSVASSYFSPIMIGDTIFGLGTIDTTTPQRGEVGLVTLMKPPFICPGNDDDTVVATVAMACRDPPTRSSLLSGIRGAMDGPLGEYLDTVATTHHLHGDVAYRHLVAASLHMDMEALLVWWYKKRCLRRLYLLGLTRADIMSSGYDDPTEIFSIIVDCPYRLPCLDTDKCETILGRMGRSSRPIERYRGQITRSIRGLLDKKITHLSMKDLISRYPDASAHLGSLVSEYGLSQEGDRIGLQAVSTIEAYVGSILRQALTRSKRDVDSAILDPLLNRHQADPDQVTAVTAMLGLPVCVLTGGAGTGKTSSIRIVVEYIQACGKTAILTSFTGKAVSRIKEVIPTSKPMTLHRLLQGSIPDPFPDYIIIDEASMLETDLFYQFSRRYRLDQHPTSLIFIGDLNQLPPIGWGCLFNQIIDSGVVPILTLTVCHRMDGQGIRDNITRLLGGSFFEPSPDFHLEFGASPLSIIQQRGLNASEVRIVAPYVETVAEQNRILQDYFASGKPSVEDRSGATWFVGDRVMMTKNNYSIEVMNGQEGMIAYFDPDGEGIYVAFGANVHLFTFSNESVDRIVSLHPPSTGRYLDVDSGNEVLPAIGRRKKFHHAELQICGDSRIAFFNVKRALERADSSLDEDSREYPPISHLSLAYAVTVHKSQGSEWDHVIVIIPGRAKDSTFVTRNLIHTAVSRGRKSVTCVGSRLGWLKSILNLDPPCVQTISSRLRSTST